MILKTLRKVLDEETNDDASRKLTAVVSNKDLLRCALSAFLRLDGTTTKAEVNEWMESCVHTVELIDELKRDFEPGISQLTCNAESEDSESDDPRIQMLRHALWWWG